MYLFEKRKETVMPKAGKTKTENLIFYDGEMEKYFSF